MGEVWRVDTRSGAYAVKRLFWDERLAADDVAFQLAVLDAGVRLPRPILAIDGRAVVDRHRVYEWMDLVEIASRPASAAAIEDVATALSRIHGVAWPAGGDPDPWYWEPVGEERWDAALRNAINAGEPWALALDALRPDLLKLDEIIAAAPARPLIRCHLDYNRSNVCRDAGGHVVVLDWENSGPGVAEREVAGALLDWATDDARVADRAAVDRFTRAYGDFAADDLTVFAMRVSAWAHYLAMVCENVVDPTSPADHLRYWRVDVDAMLHRPLTIDNLESMLEAIHAVGSG